MIATRTVAIRIETGSQEADYLSTYYSISDFPCLIMIRYLCILLRFKYHISINARDGRLTDRIFSNGEVVLELKTGATKRHFKESLRAALNSLSSQTAALPASSLASHRSQLSLTATSQSSPDSLTNSNLSAADTDIDEDYPTQPSTTLQDLLQHRRQRLEAKKREDATEQMKRMDKAAARSEATDNASTSAKSKQVLYALQQKRRQQEERNERERIRRDIANDRLARKEKEDKRRAVLEAESAAADGNTSVDNRLLSSGLQHKNPSKPKQCALQVRLFDGSTIRWQFLPHETLRIEVRSWINKQGSEGDTPYTFKEILSPTSNRVISISEEEASLQSLGFMPSTTLVKIPISGYTTAYDRDKGLIFKGLFACYSIASTGIGKISNAISTIIGLDQAVPHREEIGPQGTSAVLGSSPSQSSNEQPENRQEQQFYNGNQVRKV